MEFDRLLAFWGHHFVLIGVWISLALSLNLINGFTGLFSLGHQGFWGVGAYVAAVFMTVLPSIYPEALGEPGVLLFLLSFPVGIAVSAFFGLLVGVPCLRMRGDYLAIATLGFGEIFRNLLMNTRLLGQSQGLTVNNIIKPIAMQIFGNRHAAQRAQMFFYIILAWGVALLTLIILRNLMKSAHGRAITAIRDDETAAELLGVNLTRYKVLVFVLGAGLAGLAGVVYGHYQAYVDPQQFGFMPGVTLLVIVVMGGMGSFTGTIIATFLIYLIPVLLSFAPETWKIPIFYDLTQGGDGWVRKSLKDLWQVFFAMMLIVVVLVRPEGIMGKREVSFSGIVRYLKARMGSKTSTS